MGTWIDKKFSYNPETCLNNLFVLSGVQVDHSEVNVDYEAYSIFLNTIFANFINDFSQKCIPWVVVGGIQIIYLMCQ